MCKARRILLASLFVAAFVTIAVAEKYSPGPVARVKMNLSCNPWKFLIGDPQGASGVSFNDAAWRTVGIPHTWSDTQSFLNQASGGPGPNFNASTWYRTKFTLDNAWAGRKVFIEFRGAGIGAAVYVNGTFIKGNSAYNPNATHVIAFIPFIVDATPYITFGQENTLAVKVSSSGGFYADPGFAVAFKYGMGCNGLFRPVYLHVCDKIYVPANVYSVVNNWGTYVAALTATDASASVKILTHVKNESGAAATVTLTTKIVDQAQTVVWSEDKTQTVPSDSAVVFDQTANVTNPHLWYPNNSKFGKPYMYKVYHIVKSGGQVRDIFTSPLGIRVITWNNDFPLVNGHPHYLWGGASRYDYPALGCAVPDEQQWRDAKLMADIGGSLWRPGHATASGEFTEACDQFGVMIMQPSGDIEGTLANPSATMAGLKKEFHRDMIVRDRNNPSILAWEVSNGPISADLETDIRKNIDSVWDPVHTRAMSDRGYWNAAPQVAAGVVGIVSCSFTGCEVAYHQKYPTTPSWGAEAWDYNARDFRFNYDGELKFATSYVQNWKSSKNANCFGLVQWYLAETPGEDGVGRSFGTSAMDWNRIPKMLYHIYAACWSNYPERPVVRLAHHWNRGGAVQVNAFSNCPSVRLRINGKDQGTKVPFQDTTNDNSLLPHQCQWNVNFEAGTLRAEGLDANGNVVCFDEKKTAGSPAKIVLTVADPIVKPCDGDTFKIYANGSDAAFILAAISDAEGNWCPTSSPNVTFAVSGPGDYRGGADNNTSPGGQFAHSPGDHELAAEGGMCKVAVRSTFTPGTVTVTATSGGLTGSTTFKTYPVPPPQYVAVRQQQGRPFVALTPAFRVHAENGKIRYFVGEDAALSVTLLDAAGRTVAHIDKAEVSRGWHALAPNLSKKSSGNGVYFVRFEVDGGYSCVKQIAVVR
jgi:beta-galactosidase